MVTPADRRQSGNQVHGAVAGCWEGRSWCIAGLESSRRCGQGWHRCACWGGDQLRASRVQALHWRSRGGVGGQWRPLELPPPPRRRASHRLGGNQVVWWEGVAGEDGRAPLSLRRGVGSQCAPDMGWHCQNPGKQHMQRLTFVLEEEVGTFFVFFHSTDWATARLRCASRMGIAQVIASIVRASRPGLHSGMARLVCTMLGKPKR
mmetsp:Transcript_75061/g.195280  ORF Transcript_75061/g.195280 Transcript_75061/m.195280 type:complete len:205 (+) Transcript_75061:943-1557(+)